MTDRLFIVDTSYLVFYRFHAIRMWLSKAKPEISLDGVEDITSIPEFMKTYQSTFFKTLEKIIKSEGVRPENIIFARDCSSQDVWRRLIFPDYKGNRDYTNFCGKTIFQWTYDNLLPVYIQLGAKVIRFDYIEADDIAALIVMNCPDRDITIITNDNDYLQLLKYPRLKLLNLKEEDLKKRSIGTPNGDLMKKIVLGDPSDNIPKVFSKCGPKTLEKYLADEKLFNDSLDKEPDARKRYKLNRVLVDFEQIPTHYKDEVKAWISNNISN